MIKIDKVETREKVLLLLSRIATGWRKPHDERSYLSFKNGIPKLLEYIKVDEVLCLIWNVDVIEENERYIQILRVWDVLPWFEIPKLVIDLNTFFSTYSMEHLNFCKFRCSQGYVCTQLLLLLDMSFIFFGDCYAALISQIFYRIPICFS